MAKYDGATIEIINWDKYNPRKDVKRPHWYRFTNCFFEDPQFFDFNGQDLWVLIYILSQASKKQRGAVVINWGHVERIGRIREKDFISTIEKLLSIQFVRITLSDPYADVTDTSRGRNATLQDITGQDTETSDVPSVLSELDDPLAREVLEKVKTEIQTAWVQTYQDTEWLRHECKLAATWCRSNPSRKPKSDWAKFMNGWLARNWERKRKTLSTVPPLRPLDLEAL